MGLVGQKGSLDGTGQIFQQTHKDFVEKEASTPVTRGHVASLAEHTLLLDVGEPGDGVNVGMHETRGATRVEGGETHFDVSLQVAREDVGEKEFYELNSKVNLVGSDEMGLETGSEGSRAGPDPVQQNWIAEPSVSSGASAQSLNPDS